MKREIYLFRFEPAGGSFKVGKWARDLLSNHFQICINSNLSTLLMHTYSKLPPLYSKLMYFIRGELRPSI
uniref:Uncharacterized protein n=1 Tax=Cucumis melo TaxID=3656 RepID=A0A9I9EMD2_CUCME